MSGVVPQSRRGTTISVVTAGRRYGGETVEERAARRRRQLLDAGLALFGSTGYRTATVRQICAQAKVADRNFYDEFDGLEDLLLAVYAECTDRLEAATLAAVATVDPADVLAMSQVGLEAFLQVVEEDPRLARIVWFEVLGVSPRVESTYLARMTRFGQMMLSLMPHTGALPPEQLAVLGEVAVGGVSQATTAWLVSGCELPRSTLAGVLAQVLDASQHVAGAPAPRT